MDPTRKMTSDTERAMEIILPMAKEFNIDVKADFHCLYCNGQAIGIACNSTYATLNEFLGYAMYWMSARNHSRWNQLPEQFEKLIKEYWVSEETLKEWRKHWEGSEHEQTKAAERTGQDH